MAIGIVHAEESLAHTIESNSFVICNGPNVALLIHITSYTENDENMTYFVYVYVKNVASFPSNSSYMGDMAHCSNLYNKAD